MRFSHTADCHIGGHRDTRLRDLTERAFMQFIDGSIKHRVDFAIIAGDLFNTAIPGIDTLKFTVTQLGRLRSQGIPVYAIPGSHDYSPSGKTMLDVLEEAGLLMNVCKGNVTTEGKLKLAFTIDKKTGVKLTGVIGRRGMLDRAIYEELDRSIERETGKKVFLFHTSISELKPQHLAEMESAPVSFLPKGFDYYAGGHVHIVERYDEAARGYRNVVYPGPLFPNSFSELERLGSGGYYVYDDARQEGERLIREELPQKRVVKIELDAQGMSAHDASAKLASQAAVAEPQDSIVLVRATGMLSSGNPGDLDLRSAVRHLEDRGAYIVLRSTSQLTSSEFKATQIDPNAPHQDLQERLLAEHGAELALDGMDGTALARELLKLLSREAIEGEKLHEYESRMTLETLKLIDDLRKRG
ncbi:TPA: DNA repair exonuclease [Candidatus Woesearchaeota archaeon]|nr:DNA repair exonuclease [Candidatus Woesearchaeota archaeon]